MASSNCLKGSWKSFTALAISLSVTSFMEMPAASRSCMVLFAPSTFSVRLGQLAVIAERVEGCGRNGVYRVRANELFHVKHVAVFGILRAGAGPEQALRLS